MSHLPLPPKFSRYIWLFFILSLLVVLGHLEAEFYNKAEMTYAFLFTKIGLSELIRASSAPTAEVTKMGSRLVTATYDVLFCTLSLLLIHLYVRNWAVSKMALVFYIGATLLTILINETGKVIPYEPFRILAYRLMATIVSPLPIVMIIPAISLLSNTQKEEEPNPLPFGKRMEENSPSVDVHPER